MMLALIRFYLRQLFSLGNVINFWALGLLSSLFVAGFVFAQQSLPSSQLSHVYWLLFFVSLQGLGFGALRVSLSQEQDEWLAVIGRSVFAQTLAKICALSVYILVIAMMFLAFEYFLHVAWPSFNLGTKIFLFAPLLSLYMSCYLVTFEKFFPAVRGRFIGHLLVPFWIAPLMIMLSLESVPKDVIAYKQILFMVGITLVSIATTGLVLVISTRNISLR